MKLHKCILIGVVFALAIGLASAKVSFACWLTNYYTYECCRWCCEDEAACFAFKENGDRSKCSPNVYCLFFPLDCYLNYCDKSAFCPFPIIINGDQTKLDVLRGIRDTRLLKTAVGKSLVDLFYQHAEEVTAILRADEDLLAITANITDEIVERALAPSSNEKMVIDQELVMSMLEVSNLIAEEAGPELSRTIQMINSEIEKKELFEKLDITINY